MSDEDFKTKLPVHIVDELTFYIAWARENFEYVEERRITGSEASTFLKMLAYLDNLREIYSKCGICGKIICPDEAAGYDEPSGHMLCVKCATGGA